MSSLSSPAPAQESAKASEFEIIIGMIRQMLSEGRSPTLQRIHSQAAQKLVQFRVAHPTASNHRDADRVEQAFRFAEELISTLAKEAAARRTQHA